MGLKYVNREKNEESFYFSDEDNTNVCEELKVWRPKRLEAREKGLPMSHAPIPEYTAIKIQQIVNHLSTRYNYYRYWFRDEMVDEAITNAMAYLHSFDPEQIGPRSGRVNFHSWVTTSAERIFSNYIEKEDEERYHKLKAIELNGGLEAFINDEPGVALDANILDNNDMGNDIMERIYAFENKRSQKIAKQKARRQERLEKTKPVPKNKLAARIQTRKNKENTDENS